MARWFKLMIGALILALLVALAPLAGGPTAAAPLADGYLSGCTGEYFNNTDLSGSPAFSRVDSSVNFFWPENTSPAPGIGVNNYGVRWTCSFYVSTPGNYNFNMVADDGMNLVVNGNLLIWAWYDQGPSSYSQVAYLNAGWQTARVEYYNRTLAGTARVWYGLGTPPPVITPTPVPPSPGGTGPWYGQYFNNISLAGAPVFTRYDSSVHFDWGYGSPDPSVPVDYFSAKWDSTQYLPVTGNYTIWVSSDDGVRAWIDGALVVDAWYDHSPTLFAASRWYGAGLHNVHIEYYEKTMTAMVGFDIFPAQQVPQPSADVIVDNAGTGWQAGGKSSGWKLAYTGYANRAYWTFNNAYVAPYYNWARWYPTLPHAGYYEVFAYIPAGIATTTNARYWVYHAGRYDYAPRAQVFYGNQWVSLGTYYFNASGGENVSLADVTYECYLCRTLVFDAMKFSPR